MTYPDHLTRTDYCATLITQISCKISREFISPTKAEVCSAYAATAIVEASFEQIHHLVARISRNHWRVVALYGVLSEHVRVILRVANCDDPAPSLDRIVT